MSNIPNTIPLSPLAKQIVEATQRAFTLGYTGTPNRFTGEDLATEIIGHAAPLYNHLLKRAYTAGLQLHELETK